MRNALAYPVLLFGCRIRAVRAQVVLEHGRIEVTVGRRWICGIWTCPDLMDA
jgi:hypothetical protein